MRKIKLMADYYCHPLWGTSIEDMGDISPEDLPLSSELKDDLNEWAKRFNAILNEDDPASSGFINDEEEQHFMEDGYKLAECLRNELGPDYEIIYQP